MSSLLLLAPVLDLRGNTPAMMNARNAPSSPCMVMTPMATTLMGLVTWPGVPPNSGAKNPAKIAPYSPTSAPSEEPVAVMPKPTASGNATIATARLE
ncbi:hypothetical protein ACWD3I_46075 [Streptomyces sp. NPDC002817]|uniref:hypothetical protein n=1 Tax=Streptomyces sp. NPDC088357 TaxID=3154655 RepID=UPI003428064C